MGQVSERARQLVLTRDEFACTARGQLPGTCRGHLDMGHIIGRGMGGGDLYDAAQWLLTQCRHHNGLVEDATGETRQLITRLGMHISRNSTALIPEAAVVRYPDGRWYRLLPDGTKERSQEHDQKNAPGLVEWVTPAWPARSHPDVQPVRP